MPILCYKLEFSNQISKSSQKDCTHIEVEYLLLWNSVRNFCSLNIFPFLARFTEYSRLYVIISSYPGIVSDGRPKLSNILIINHPQKIRYKDASIGTQLTSKLIRIDREFSLTNIFICLNLSLVSSTIITTMYILIT